ncbi:MAG TPA: hypothetical protein VK968_19400 [Roseimicrobium sp.]|nr:hypothetical protein [Roseimicrobium sp.]
MRTLLSLTVALTAAAALTGIAAEPPKLPAIPEQSIAKKKELLFSDDFSSATPDKRWHRVVDTFKIENGMLKGTQTRVKDEPSKDGKSIITAHAAVYGLELPTKDTVVECRIKLDGASLVDVEFDDRAYKGAHYGHLCRAQVRTNGIVILDERDGTQNEEIKELKKDPTKKDEVAKRMKGKTITYPAKVESGVWHNLVVETVGESMRVVLDGKPVAFLKSSGIGHATKSKLEFGTSGQSGYFDDIKIWNAEPAK